MAKEYDISTNSFKHQDTTKTLSISFRDSNGCVSYPNPQHTYTAKVGNESGYLGDYPVTARGNRFIISTSELTDLPKGDYVLEIWENYIDDDGKTQTSIYPSPDAQVPFVIKANIMDKTGTVIKELGFDDLAKAAAKQACKQLDVTIGSVTMASPDTQPSVKRTVSDTGQVVFDITLPRGKQGDKGDPGDPGKAPVKGVDYWTDADKQAIQNEDKQYIDSQIKNSYTKARDDTQAYFDDLIENHKF